MQPHHAGEACILLCTAGLSPPARCHSRLAEAYRPTGSCRWPAGRMQHGAVSVLWRQISQCQRLGGVRTASQRNSYFGGIALRLRCSPVIIRSLVSEPLPQVCHCPVDSDVVVHLPQSWPFASRRVWAMGICGWPWFSLGPRNPWSATSVAGSLAVRCSYRFHSSSRRLSHGAD
jgi:hypothetical protein